MLELGTTPDTAGAQLLLDHIRCQILLHSAAHRLAPPLDGVYPDFANKEGLAAVARQVRDMGFAGMLCIHPAQVAVRSEEHTSELQSLMRISYAVFCLKKKKKRTQSQNKHISI